MENQNIEKFIIAIPARLESSRLPRKVLRKIGNLTMIERVIDKCLEGANGSPIVLCTDNIEIKEVIQKKNCEVLMTSTKCSSGSERIASVLKNIISLAWKERINEKDESFFNYLLNKTAVINIQADQPFLDSKLIGKMKSAFSSIENKNVDVITPIYKLNKDKIFNPNVVKTIINSKKEAIYFSRSTIPYIRNEEKKNWYKVADYWGHAGIYGFKSYILEKWSSIPNSFLEKAEKLEQLKLIEAGYKVGTFEIEEESLSIDTIEQLNEAIKKYEEFIY